MVSSVDSPSVLREYSCFMQFPSHQVVGEKLGVSTRIVSSTYIYYVGLLWEGIGLENHGFWAYRSSRALNLVHAESRFFGREDTGRDGGGSRVRVLLCGHEKYTLCTNNTCDGEM